MIRRPPRSTQFASSAASDVYKRQVEISKTKFDPKSIDEALEKSRNQFANIVPVTNRAAKLGDIAVVSFKGKYKDSGKEIDGGTSESMDLELEKNKMLSLIHI